jgi:anticodon nuclease
VVTGTLNYIASQLKSKNKKAQLIYAFNGMGKTRLSVEFKNLIESGADENSYSGQKKIIYYNAFTQDLFYWDNDIENDVEPKLKIQPNSFTSWIFEEQGLDKEVIDTFQLYLNKKLEPKFSEDFSDVIFYCRGDENQTAIKISKGEENLFIWCIFYVLVKSIIEAIKEKSTDEFDGLKYIFIDDPVSSLDENNIIEMAINLAGLIKSAKNLNFIITTHNPLFYNVLYNELKTAGKFFLKNIEDENYILEEQENNSPFAYHLYLKAEVEKAIKSNQIKKYHFNFLRNILEKTSTFLGYGSWKDFLLEILNKENVKFETMLMSFSSHSSHSADEVKETVSDHEKTLKEVIECLNNIYYKKGKK